MTSIINVKVTIRESDEIDVHVDSNVRTRVQVSKTTTVGGIDVRFDVDVEHTGEEA